MLAKLELVHTQRDTKCSFPLGPYPRYTWIHKDTPEDGLDKACYEIWKRVQQLSAQLDCSSKEVTGSEPGQAEDAGDTVRGKAGKRVADSCGKDDVSLLVQLEYLSIVAENSGGVDLQQNRLEGNDQMVSILETKTKELQDSEAESLDKTNFLNNFLKSGSGTELSKDSLAKEEVAEEKQVRCGSKEDLEVGSRVSVASNKEICQLLAQFSLKHIHESEAPDNKVVMEEAQIIKDFLQNSMFSSAGDKRAQVSPPLPLASREPQDEQARRQLPVFAKLCEEPPACEDEGHSEPLALTSGPGLASGLAQDRPSSGSELVRLLCGAPREVYRKEAEGRDSPEASSPDARPSRSEHSYSTSRHSLKGLAPSARRAGPKDVTRPRELAGPQHLLARRGDGGKDLAPEAAAAEGDAGSTVEAEASGSGGHLGPEFPDMERHPVGPGPHKHRAGREMEADASVLVGSNPPPPPPSSPSSPSATRRWLQVQQQRLVPHPYPALPGRPALINYPAAPPAPAPPTATATASPATGYGQQPPFYPGRGLRLPLQQPAYPQAAGCFLRSAGPGPGPGAYTYGQVAQEFVPRHAYIRAAYAPLLGYWSFVPEYPYSARGNATSAKPLASAAAAAAANNPPPMAGDGPQCLFQPAYGYLDTNLTATRFGSARSGPLYSGSNFQVYYPADSSGYNCW
ncbi:LOW QUALITY PROTEIN: uncharacterized protein C1orf94-like [Leucoraja erinacea]|uniref:LOW QUALITY PROTEIN: uncharacterized protein C1orf94-like n=1 Tax=Leucoraja erinaceus TaxID=7782 RepID=UPI00245868D2|nr:LOW QUALITY PROTEIN: uncharacterized protein C1orf94-like [Leucoraja erinacea]